MKQKIEITLDSAVTVEQLAKQLLTVGYRLTIVGKGYELTPCQVEHRCEVPDCWHKAVVLGKCAGHFLRASS